MNKVLNRLVNHLHAEYLPRLRRFLDDHVVRRSSEIWLKLRERLSHHISRYKEGIALVNNTTYKLSKAIDNFVQNAYYYKKNARAEVSEGRSLNKIDISFSWNTVAKTALLVAFAFLVEHQNVILGLGGASILVPSPATWGSSVVEVCPEASESCVFHSFIHEHDKSCTGTFYDCASLVHTVSTVGPKGPFERMNYTLLQPGHPSSTIARVSRKSYILVTSVYREANISTNLSFCENYPLNEVLQYYRNVEISIDKISPSGEAKSWTEDPDTIATAAACENVGCVFSTIRGHCTTRANIDADGKERHGPTALRLNGHPFDHSDSHHVYRGHQGQKFDLMFTSDIGGSNGTVNWTKRERVFQGRPIATKRDSKVYWDEYIGDPSLTILDNGTVILLYRGWRKGFANQSKIGIASTNNWRKEPFRRLGEDGILLESEFGNESYGEPSLLSIRKVYACVFRSKPAETPYQILHAYGKLNEENGNLELHKDILGSDFHFLAAQSSSHKALDAKGKIRNGAEMHPDEIFEYGRPMMLRVGLATTPVFTIMSAVRHNTPVPRSLVSVRFQSMIHRIMYDLGLAPYYYKTEQYPPLPRTLIFDVVQGVQGVSVDDY